MNAFPNPHLTDQLGMTLRDYFAAKAMEAYITSHSKELEVHQYMCANWSYRMADVMMEIRNAAQ
jgi:hypothetical protein